MYRLEKSNDYKDLINTKNINSANQAYIEYGDGEVFFKANGEVAAIEIRYEGAFKGINTLGAGWHIKAGRKKVIIWSYAQTPLQERIFNYIGKLKIKSAVFATWDLKKYKVQIKSTERVTWGSSYGNWNSDTRKPNLVEPNMTIHKDISKTKI